MLSIDNQAPLLSTLNNLNRTQSPIEKSMERLSSGKQVNSASDNPAALAIAARLAEQLLGGDQSTRNINDGVSLVQTAEGALSEVADSVQRMRELAVQSGNGLLSDADRQALQAEMSELQEQVGQTLDTTQFNGVNPFQQDGNLTFQAGSEAGDTVSVATRDLRTELTDAGFFSIDVSSASGAADALGFLDQTAGVLSDLRSDLGASQNRFESAIRNLETQNENVAAAQSRIMDTDYARTTAELSRGLIQQQAGLAMSSQANVSAGLINQLLNRG